MPRIVNRDHAWMRDRYGDLVPNPDYQPPQERRVPLLGPQVPSDSNPLPDFRYSNATPVIHNWSHKPRPLFRGTGPLHFGLELEVTFGSAIPGARCAEWFLRDLGYLKHDSSVEGFEIVTHPMSYPWFSRNFPFEMLPELARNGGVILPRNNGLHVHVSRAGFSGASLAYRWMMFMYRNSREVERLGGRHSQYASFDSSNRRGQFFHLKNTLLREKGGYPDPESDDIEQDSFSHYAAINNMPRETYEVRVFAATLDPEVLKSRVQLVAASIEYARGMRAKDITREHAWDWAAFAKWVTARKKTYRELARVVTSDGTAARANAAAEAARRAEAQRLQTQVAERIRQNAERRAAQRTRLNEARRQDEERDERLRNLLYNYSPDAGHSW